jgi:hemolysin III
MGWVALLALTAFLTVLPWTAVATLVLGGVFYTIGGLSFYALRWPDPWPRVLGYHEMFHLLVIAGSVAFAVCIWIWALPFPRR